MDNDMYFDQEDQDGGTKDIRRRKKKLYSQIRERMEFYFSDANLRKDRFMANLIERDPQVDLSVFLHFNRILQLTTNLHDVQKALKKSELLQLNEDKTKVFRTKPVPEKDNIDACTIYVEQLTQDADHDWLTEVFSKFGKVDYVSIPKYKNSGKIKGFAFVEFAEPESAKKALEEFEKAGCCLTSQMRPDKLCSITTFEADKSEPKDETKGDINEDQEIKNAESVKGGEEETEEVSKKKATKRKNADSQDEALAGEATNKKKKKEASDTESVDNKKENGSDFEQATETNNAEGESESYGLPAKKKKNRKKKKSHKTKYDNNIQSYGLQILSKTDWKRLRNKYLDAQKEQMKRLKQQLHRNQIQLPEPAPEPDSKPRFDFEPGLVVKVTFDEPLPDNNKVAQFKSEAKSLENVKYVDASVDKKEAYIRFGDASAVSEVLHSNRQPWENMVVLEGNEEKKYWEKMKSDRLAKFADSKKIKKKGRHKLVQRAEKLISKKIRLSVEE